MITLTDTNASEIAAAFLTERTRGGSPAMGMVMTLVVVTDEEHSEDALKAARAAAREHPSRVLCMVMGSPDGEARVEAEVGIGQRRSGETALITLVGEVVEHAESVVRPLLLSDSPVAVWWACDAPEEPALDPIGAMAQRRITDAAAVLESTAKKEALARLCRHYSPGDTDLAWTRITPWRALLAAALDQHPVKITGASVSGEKICPSTELLAGWLEDRLSITCELRKSAGPEITDVVLETLTGQIRISREHGANATLSIPDSMDRTVSLKKRSLPDLLAEELRHLDEDEIYAATVRHLLKGLEH